MHVWYYWIIRPVGGDVVDPIIEIKEFSRIQLNDPFFDTLKEDYPGFEEWFLKKKNECAHVLYNKLNTIDAFLYIKQETGPITDVQPALEEGPWLKIGTMKVNPHGTRLGERLIKKLLDHAIVNGLGKVYVTIFPKHTHLVKLFMKYGFIESAKKETNAGIEMVLTKNLQKTVGETLLDYPLVITKTKNKHLLAINPEYHTKLFPDSI